MILVIDADYLLYVTLYHFRKDDTINQVEYFGKRVRELTKEVEIALGSEYEEVILAFSDLTNFRHEIDPMYKSKRKPRPDGYLKLKAEVGQKFNVEQWDNFEADDICGWYAMYKGADIASQDNDVYTQVPIAYNIARQEVVMNTPLDISVALYTKAIKGDRVDGVKALPKRYRDKMLEMLELIPKDAQKLIQLINDQEVAELYIKNLSLVDINRLHENKVITWN